MRSYQTVGRMTVSVFVYASVILAALWGERVCADDTWTHHSTGITLPMEICFLTRGKPLTYEPKLGVSVPYGIKDRAKVTVYLYNMGIPEIPDGAESKAVKDQFEMAIRDVQMRARVGDYVFLKEGSMGTKTFQTNRGTQNALFKSFTYNEAGQGSEPGTALNSYLVLTGYKNHFVKIRFTCVKDPMCSEDFLQCFLDEFGALLR